ncbi:hypothetical protein LJR235_002918 [Pararhizobium sp. LjRoot235]|uniref:carph-isopro domain-containing protein n=1 Tax=Pararhizobium sp. LjRoot235 TaxID=3342291 RepID=UPI003ED11B56
MEAKSPAEFIINELGGLTKTAKALSRPERPFAISTVQGWKERGRIPQEHWDPLIEAGCAAGKHIEYEMFLKTPEAAQ